MNERVKLEIVDDPVAGPSQVEPPPETVRQSSLKAYGAPPEATYGEEERRAIFGRVPRSLARRLERAVVELRDEFEDLTQEQVLAALLHAHVDSRDQAELVRLTEIVRSYRQELFHRR